jgi:hypothetical protein
VARQRCAVRKRPHAGLGTRLSNLTDTVGFQLQLLKSLGRKPPSHDFCFPLRTQNLANFLRRSAARDSGRPILNLITAGSYDDMNRICFCNRVFFRFCARHKRRSQPEQAHPRNSFDRSKTLRTSQFITIELLLTTSDFGFKQ